MSSHLARDGNEGSATMRQMLLPTSGLVLLLGCFALLAGDDPDSKTDKAEEEKKAIAKQRYLHNTHTSLHADRDAWPFAEDDQIALYSAWKTHAATVDEDSNINGKKIDPLKLARFAGVIEGRLRVDIPIPWEKALHTARVRRKRVLIDAPTPLPIITSQSGLHITDRPGMPECEITDTGLRLRRYAFSCIVPSLRVKDRLLGEDVWTTNAIAFEFDSNRVFAVVYNIGTYFPTDLYCIDYASGNVLWKSSAIGFSPENIPIVGKLTHWCDIRVTNDRVFVFGSGTWNLYIESFDRNTGQRRLRFDIGRIRDQ